MPRPYEAVYVFDSTLEDAAVTEKLDRFHQLLGTSGELKVEPPTSKAGDHILLAPPFIVTERDVDDIVDILGAVIDESIAAARR